jgi:hypothetical protein
MMVCFAWWWLLLMLSGAVVFGFVLYFAWSWWLLSRPDSPRQNRR